MTPTQLKAAKDVVMNRIRSLENDHSRAFFDILSEKIAVSPFPVVMYALSVLDLLSSLEVGWNEGKPGRSQTARMVNYLENRMGYDRKASKILVQMHRHQLMHTSEPRLIKDKNTNDIYSWSISPTDNEHMTLKPFPDEIFTEYYYLMFGIFEFVRDLRVAAETYLNDLSSQSVLQENYNKCMNEIGTKVLEV